MQAVATNINYQQVYTQWNTFIQQQLVVHFEYIYWSKDSHETTNRERQNIHSKQQDYTLIPKVAKHIMYMLF